MRCLQLVYVTDCHFLFCEAFLQFPSTWAPCWAAEEITIQLLNAKEQGMSQTIGNFIEVVTQNLMQGINAKSKYLVWQQNYLVKLLSFFFQIVCMEKKKCRKIPKPTNLGFFSVSFWKPMMPTLMHHYSFSEAYIHIFTVLLYAILPSILSKPSFHHPLSVVYYIFFIILFYNLIKLYPFHSKDLL